MKSILQLDPRWNCLFKDWDHHTILFCIVRWSRLVACRGLECFLRLTCSEMFKSPRAREGEEFQSPWWELASFDSMPCSAHLSWMSMSSQSELSSCRNIAPIEHFLNHFLTSWTVFDPNEWSVLEAKSR